jgi:hypothetical protein
MRFSFTLGVVIASITLAGWAQTKPAKPLKMKPTSEFMVKGRANEGKSGLPAAPAGKATGSSTARNLQMIEREHPIRSTSHPAKKLPAAALQTDKDRANPKISFTGSGSGSKGASNRAAPNAYRGRLKQKGSH